MPFTLALGFIYMIYYTCYGLFTRIRHSRPEKDLSNNAQYM